MAVIINFLGFCLIETGCQLVAQAGLEIALLGLKPRRVLLEPPKSWDYRQIPLSFIFTSFHPWLDIMAHGTTSATWGY